MKYRARKVLVSFLKWGLKTHCPCQTWKIRTMVLHRQVFLVACYLQLQLTLNFTFVQHRVNCSMFFDLLYLHLQEELLLLWVSFSYVTILSYMNGVHTLTAFTFLPSKQPWEEGGLKNPIWNYMVNEYVSLHPYWLGYHKIMKSLWSKFVKRLCVLRASVSGTGWGEDRMVMLRFCFYKAYVCFWYGCCFQAYSSAKPTAFLRI